MGRALLVLAMLLGCSELKGGYWTPDASREAGVDAGAGTDAGVAVDAGAALDVGTLVDVGVCPRDTVRCGVQCVDVREDDANCGRCGVRCADREECRGGRCR